jgi:hypothetical protein
MKNKFEIGLFVIGLLGLSVFLFMHTAPIHAEEIIPTILPGFTDTPTLEISSTQTPTPQNTEEMIATETPISLPTILPSVEQTEAELTITPTLLIQESFSPIEIQSSPTPTPGKVWFEAKEGIQSFDTINEALNMIYLGLLPKDGYIHLSASYGTDPDIVEENPYINIYYSNGNLPKSSSLKGLIGPKLALGIPRPNIMVPLSVLGLTDGFTISDINFEGSWGDFDRNYLESMVKIANVDGTVKFTNVDVLNHDPSGAGIVVMTNDGSIQFNNVDSSGNEGGGAYLQTGEKGSISITNGTFDNNNSLLLSTGMEINGLVLTMNQSNDPI